MPIAQMVLISHQPAPAGMVSDPVAVTYLDPTWDQIKDAIRAMNETKFMVLLSSRMDVDAPSDPDALAIEFGEGHGYMLYQQALHTEIGKSAWRTRSTANVLVPSDITIGVVLQIAAAYRNGLDFDLIDQKFPGV